MRIFMNMKITYDTNKKKKQKKTRRLRPDVNTIGLKHTLQP